MRLFLALLLLAMPLLARTPKPAPKATPAPAVEQEKAVPLVAPIPDSELDKITPEDIEKTKAHRDELLKHADDRADKAQTETATAIAKAAIADYKAGVATAKEQETEGKLKAVDAKYAKAEQQIEDDKKTIAKFNKVVRYIAAIAATFVALFAFREAKPAGLLSMLSPATLGASIALPVIAWVVTFGLVEAYMHWFF